MTEWEDGDSTLHRRRDSQDRRDIRNASGWFDRAADMFEALSWDTAARNAHRFRRGNVIIADGEIVHGFGQDEADRVFDFNPGQPGHAAAMVAEGAKHAKPFSYGYRHKERNRTTIRILDDGTRVIERSEWSALR